MTKKNISKLQAKKQINDFFKNIKSKSAKDVKKIKRLAMRYNIHLGKLRKKFCKKCLTPYTGKEKTRINKGIKTIICNNCGYKARWKIKKR